MYGFGGLGEVEVEIWSDVTIAGRTDDKKGKIGLLSQWTMEGWDEQQPISKRGFSKGRLQSTQA